MSPFSSNVTSKIVPSEISSMLVSPNTDVSLTVKVAVVSEATNTELSLSEEASVLSAFSSADASPLGASPLGASPLGASPLGASPLGASPLGASPLGTWSDVLLPELSPLEESLSVLSPLEASPGISGGFPISEPPPMPPPMEVVLISTTLPSVNVMVSSSTLSTVPTTSVSFNVTELVLSSVVPHAARFKLAVVTATVSIPIIILFFIITILAFPNLSAVSPSVYIYLMAIRYRAYVIVL